MFPSIPNIKRATVQKFAPSIDVKIRYDPNLRVIDIHYRKLWDRGHVVAAAAEKIGVVSGPEWLVDPGVRDGVGV